MPNPVKTRSYSQTEVTISELVEKESEQVRGCLAGTVWLSVENGRVVTHSKLAPLPNPIEDVEMQPFWSAPTKEEVTHLEQFTFEELDPRVTYSRHITIQSLCGYNYSKKNYENQAWLLKNYGFVQMRSPRGINGGFWEIWYLPGIHFASGDLLHAINDAKRDIKVTDSEKDKKIFKVALEFIRKHVQFGTLDISIQRMAMVIDD